ncbi:alpha/beta hydrolase [Limimaricola sp. AA108-03]|uniref:alpha/beta hydrolase n=1 Tax=Limimaricola sp. AA108-03 TaxID=3425945 RepID=UPI003D784065
MRVTDPEILRFIAETEAAYPAEANTASTAENRRHYDAMCAVFRSLRPGDVAVSDAAVAGVPIRRYRPRGATGPFLLYAHGGGYVVGSLDSHDDVCAEIAQTTGAELLAVDYRLAPEHLYPAQLDDVETVWRAESVNRPGFVLGDSAGGALMAALCLRMRRMEGPMPLAQCLIYPGLGGDMSAPSYAENAEAPLLRTADLVHYAGVLTGGDTRLREIDPELSPLRAQDFAGLPPALVVTADVDPLRDDGPAYVDKLVAAGVAAEWRNEPQLVHGYLRARHRSARAGRSFEAICDWLRTQLAGVV